MKEFFKLFDLLDSTTSTKSKRRFLVEYFQNASPTDVGWAVFFLTGQKLKRLIKSRDLRNWALERVGLAEWLFEECYAAVGDIAETIALLIENPNQTVGFLELTLSEWVETKLTVLPTWTLEEQKSEVLSWWDQLSNKEILVVNKLLTGGFRVGVSKFIVENALADWLKIPASVIAHRLMGTWTPSEKFVASLTSATSSDEDNYSQPYPFYLASPLEGDPQQLGDPSEWIIEWKWDGIRAQVVRRKDRCFIWSRGEELISDQFPEIYAAASYLPPGTVLDGEIVVWKNEKVMPFALLQQRISRKKLSAKMLQESPVKFIVFDCLEDEGKDVRSAPLTERRTKVLKFAKTENPVLIPSFQHELPDWDSIAKIRETSRENFVEGLMLKKKDSVYKTGRKRGEWWKWKIEPYSIDAVLLYAQAGHGRRANLYTDYTFAIWKDKDLVPVAKAYSGLDDLEILELDKWIRSHTKERFGPIRSLTPHHVFELGFEGIAESSRHKSGIALRFPRILRWRKDKKVDQADHLETVRKLINVPSPQNN